MPIVFCKVIQHLPSNRLASYLYMSKEISQNRAMSFIAEI